MAFKNRDGSPSIPPGIVAAIPDPSISITAQLPGKWTAIYAVLPVYHLHSYTIRDLTQAKILLSIVDVQRRTHHAAQWWF